MSSRGVLGTAETGMAFFSKEGLTLSYVLVTRGAKGKRGSSFFMLKLIG